MSQIDYIVIVYPPAPATRSGQDYATSYNHASHSPKVQMITAHSPEKAAQIAKVQPGGHAFVCVKGDAKRFDRAKEAPLVQKAPNGIDFPEEASAHA